MKRLFALLFSILTVLTLSGCAEKEEVEFYETRTYIKQSTGDINLLENTYDENWNLLQSYITLNDNFSSKTEYEYSEDFTVMTTKTTFAGDPPASSFSSWLRYSDTVGWEKWSFRAAPEMLPSLTMARKISILCLFMGTSRSSCFFRYYKSGKIHCQPTDIARFS